MQSNEAPSGTPAYSPPDTGKGHLTFIIFSSFPSYSGGRENWLFNVLQRLDRQGYETTVYACQSPEPPFHDLSSLERLRLVQVPALRAGWFRIANRLTLNLLFWLDAYLFVRRTRGQLLAEWDGGTIVAMNPIIDVCPALQLKRGRPHVRVACSVRGRPAWELSLRSPWARPLLRRLERRTLEQADVVLANGLDTQAYLEGLGIPSVVVPNGVDFARFAGAVGDVPETEHLRQMRAAGTGIIMMVATLRAVKGTYALLEAARRLKEAGRQFAIVFVGKGEQQRFRRKAGALGVDDSVWFAGEQRNVPAFLALADVSVNLSGGGGMPMATLESMAAGKAVVAWDTPVYTQLIEHGRSGLLVREGDGEALSQQLSRLLDDPDLRESLGRAAQARARDYDWSAVTESLLGALQAVGAGAERDRR